MHRDYQRGWQRLDWIAVLGGGAVVLVAALFNPVEFLARTGFPARELSNPWLRAEIVTLQVVGILTGILLIASRIVFNRRPQAVVRLSDRIDRLTGAARQFPVFIALALASLILAKTVLQLGLFVLGYSYYSGDDVGRTLRAAYWLSSPTKMDLGMDGSLGLAGAGWLPLSDVIFGPALAIHPDLFLTPKAVNLIFSAVAVVVVYLLGRELFGRRAGVLTAGLFALLPWHVWLGISGMTAELPSTVLMTTFGLYFARWLKTDAPSALLASAVALAAAGGFRYEFWLFSVVFSAAVLFSAVASWRQKTLTVARASVFATAVVIVNAFPAFWMVASYVMYGDWLPAMHQINAFMVAGLSSQTSRTEAQMGIALMAIGAFPIELALSFAGMALAMRPRANALSRRYGLMLSATVVLFAVVFKGELPAWLNIPRYLLVFIVMALPFAGYTIARLLWAPERWRHEGLLAGLMILAITSVFDVGRSLNYPASFPGDAIQAGLTLRSLQKTGTVSADAKVLIERASDWGDLGVIVLANRYERFVVLNEYGYKRTAVAGLVANRAAPATAGSADEGVRGSVCEEGFETPACRASVERERFGLAILSSPRLVESFQKTFRVPEWVIGRYHIFDLRSRLSGGHELDVVQTR